MSIKNINSLDLATLIKAISQRPRMYVGNSSFYTIAAFIDGFDYARGGEEASEMRAFSQWLAVKLSLPKNWVWFAQIQSRYPSDEDALEELPKLFDEFRKTQNQY